MLLLILPSHLLLQFFILCSVHSFGSGSHIPWLYHNYHYYKKKLYRNIGVVSAFRFVCSTAVSSWNIPSIFILPFCNYGQLHIIHSSFTWMADLEHCKCSQWSFYCCIAVDNLIQYTFALFSIRSIAATINYVRVCDCLCVASKVYVLNKWI